jgi:FAD-dependent oxidoreductase domain-containing protein 1
MIDVAIVGAGIMGASVAYWLKRLQPDLSVALIERDRTFARASSALSASSIRQQFSSPVNIAMSRFGARFIRDMGIAFNESGYLYLGSRCVFEKLNALQRQCGADIALLDADALAARFPWLNVSDIEVGSLGLSGEGWFDGAALHMALLLGARSAGAKVIDGEAAGFSIRKDSIQTIDLADGSRVACRHAVNAAGPWARALAARAGIDLPVHARRRTVFVLSCPAPLQDCPLLIDPTGFWFRPDGDVFIAGDEPAVDEDDLPLEPDLAAFDEALWARMAHRVPAFEALRVERAWAGYYEMNLFDHNAIIGPHPEVRNLWFINGFSGHGMQHAPAAGRGLAELMLFGSYRSLDLSPLGFTRLLEGKPLVEANIIG